MKSETMAQNQKQERTQKDRREEAEFALLNAAVQIIAEKGSDGLTLADVGKTAGYSRGLPAHYFGDKQGLLVAMVRHIGKLYAGDLARHDFGPPGAKALIKRVHVAYESVYQSQSVDGEGSKGAIALLVSLSESLTNPAMRGPIAIIDEKVRNSLERDILAGIASGDFRSDIDPKVETAILLGTIRGIIWHWNLDPNGVDLDKLCAAHVEKMLESLRVPEARPSPDK